MLCCTALAPGLRAEPLPSTQSPQPHAHPQPVANQQPAQQGGLITIESDTQSADNVTGVVTALGNVRIVYPARRMVATSRQAQYFSKEGRLVLSGDVDVIQEGGNALRAERVVYSLDDERAVAEPAQGGQVFSQMVIRQDQGQRQPAVTPLLP
jgi:lipopolysaccharide export system protein LptA